MALPASILSDVKGALTAMDNAAWSWSNSSYGSNRPWTRAVKQALEEKIREVVPDEIRTEQLVICGGVSECSEREWLYDFCVYAHDAEYYVDVPFVCESEWSWSFPDVRDDFFKICQSKSKYKIMIFQMMKNRSFCEKIEFMKEQANIFAVPGHNEKYLLACWLQDPNGINNGFKFYDFTTGGQE